MLRFIDKFRKSYCKISYALSAVIIVFMTCLQFFQIFYRYIYGRVFIWSNDVIIFSITTAVALAIPPLWLEHEDVTMDLIGSRLSGKADFILSVVVEIVGFIMAAVISYSGGVAIKMHRGYSTSVLRYDDSLHYWFVVYIGVMLCVVIALSLTERIIKYRIGGETNGR